MCQSEEERERTAIIIRPILRGRDIRKYGYDWADLWLINTHNGVNDELERINIEDYPSIRQHLDNYWDKIESRTDQGDTPYNLRNCAYMEDFSRPKIVWGNLNTEGKFALVQDNMFINAPACMIVPGSNYLLAFLNSRVADFYIRTQGVVRNGGFFEYKPMFIERIPIPLASKEYINAIEDIATSDYSLNEKDSKIEEIVCEVYGLSVEEIAYLSNAKR